MDSGFRIITAIPKSNTKIIDLSEGETLQTLIMFIRQEISGLSKRMPGYISPKVKSSTYQRFGRLIQDFIKKYYPTTDAYIVNHQADNTDLPKGKQLVIINEPSFDYKEIKI